MLYTTITINNKDYKCRLNARGLIECERKLKQNPLNVLMAINETNLPSLEQLLTFFHCSLISFNHGITFDDVLDIYDEYCDNGGNLTTFIEEVFMPIIQHSGLIPTEEEVIDEKDAKN